MLDYNFYGKIRLLIDTGGHQGYERYFRNEYQRITSGATPASDLPVIQLYIVDRLPETQAGELRRRVRVKSLFTFHYLVRDMDEGVVHIFFEKHYLDKLYMNAIAVFLQAQVLEPLMYYKLLQKNVLFMHAAGVCDDGRGYLFPAHGGTGKTTFSMGLLQHGYKLLGDDLLLVDVDEQMVYPYPRPLHLFTYNLRSLPGAKVPLKYWFAIYAKNLLRFVLEKTLRTPFLISTRVHADDILAGNPYGRPVAYCQLYFLVKSGPVRRRQQIDAESLPSVVADIMASADLNDSLYALLADEARIARAKALEAEVIRSLLDQVDEVVYINTRKLDDHELESFARRLREYKGGRAAGCDGGGQGQPRAPVHEER